MTLFLCSCAQGAGMAPVHDPVGVEAVHAVEHLPHDAFHRVQLQARLVILMVSYDVLRKRRSLA